MSARNKILAVIREEECIGCAKCLPACPVDSIIGAPQYTHTVIADECIGCKLCLPPCPVDCIDLIEVPMIEETREQRLEKSAFIKKRYQEHQDRYKQEEAHLEIVSVDLRRDYIAKALERTKRK